MNSNVFKIIACLLMLIDHIGMIYFPQQVIFRVIGRLAMPMFAYQMAIGIKKTSNDRRFVFRLLLLAIFSQVFYIYAAGTLRLNILFNFLMAALIIMVYKKNDILGYVALGLSALLLDYRIIDYGITIPILVFIFYRYNSFKYVSLAVISFALIDSVALSNLQLYSILAIPLIYLYRDKNTYNRKLKYAYYAFYPLHLLVLKAISTVLLCFSYMSTEIAQLSLKSAATKPTDKLSCKLVQQ